jgi:hypothetical protein
MQREAFSLEREAPPMAVTIDSKSIGDSARFRTLAALEKGLGSIVDEHQDRGIVTFLMRRGANGRREPLGEASLDPEAGVPGDAWGRAAGRQPDMQIAVMQKDVAELIANGQPLALFGDCLILDLNLSIRNLPAGSRLRVGGAILEVTPEPHNGCSKFQARFGKDALRFASAKATRHRNFRGIYMRVVEPGMVAVGDSVHVLSRGVGG